jgi:hypothetical protein
MAPTARANLFTDIPDSNSFEPEDTVAHTAEVSSESNTRNISDAILLALR